MRFLLFLISLVLLFNVKPAYSDVLIELKKMKSYNVRKCAKSSDLILVTPCNSEKLCEIKYSLSHFKCVPSATSCLKEAEKILKREESGWVVYSDESGRVLAGPKENKDRVLLSPASVAGGTNKELEMDYISFDTYPYKTKNNSVIGTQAIEKFGSQLPGCPSITE